MQIVYFIPLSPSRQDRGEGNKDAEKKALLIRVDHDEAEAILRRKRKWEYVRMPLMVECSRVLLYEDGDAKSIVGEFIIPRDGVIRGPIRQLVEITGPVSEEERRYLVTRKFRGISEAVALRVTRPERYGRPIRLAAIQAVMKGFDPTSDFQFFSSGRSSIEELMKLVRR